MPSRLSADSYEYLGSLSRDMNVCRCIDAGIFLWYGDMAAQVTMSQTVSAQNAATNGEVASADGKMTEELGVEFVCVVTQSLYRSRKTLREGTFEHCLKNGKIWLRRTLESAAVRQAIGANPQQWIDINTVFCLAIPTLETQSVPTDSSVANGATTSSALMTLHYDTLMKDLERLNDILLIARNCLATTQRAQNLAGDSLLDQQVLKLIDLCVRVTARGYDGETPSRAEQPWANVIGACEYHMLSTPEQS